MFTHTPGGFHGLLKHCLYFLFFLQEQNTVGAKGMSPDCIKLLFDILYKIIAHLFSTFIYILSYTLFIYRYRTRLTNFANKYVKTSLKQKMLEAIAGHNV